MGKVFVIGLDCATPQIVFGRKSELPNISRLMDRGVSALFRSIHPPITIPAWMAMATGKDAGQQGLYGFRHRRPGTYNDMWFSLADKLKEPPVWDIIADAGMKSCLVSVPPSYPPLPMNGNRVACFMTPGADREYTYPAALKDELEAKFGAFKFDVKFRTNDRDRLKEEVFDMTEQHMKVVKYLMAEKSWQFFMFVEIGLDRIHHAFWKYFDTQHKRYLPGNRYESVVMDYYKMLDRHIGDIVGRLDDDTVVFVVSDHGAKAMKGAFCVNQWLAEKGYLVLKREPEDGTSIHTADVDWGKTRVWAWGGYYSRIFFNIKGREEQGIIPAFRYEAWRDKIKKELSGVKGPGGEKWDTKVYRPEEIFDELNGDRPDLMAYFDDLSWRAAGTLGHKNMYLEENDTGPDDAMHDWHGVFIMYDPARGAGPHIEHTDIEEVSILDFAPTVLDIMGVSVPPDMKGRSLFRRAQEGKITDS